MHGAEAVETRKPLFDKGVLYAPLLLTERAGFSVRCDFPCGGVNNTAETVCFASDRIFVFSWHCRLSQYQTPQKRHKIWREHLTNSTMFSSLRPANLQGSLSRQLSPRLWPPHYFRRYWDNFSVSRGAQNRFSRIFREGVRRIKRIPIAAVIYWQASGHCDGERRLLAAVRERHGHAEVPV